MSGARADDGAGMKAEAWPHDMPKTTRVRASGDDDDRNMMETICHVAVRLATPRLAPLALMLPSSDALMTSIDST